MNERPTAKELKESGKDVQKWLKTQPKLVKINGKWYKVNKATLQNRKK